MSEPRNPGIERGLTAVPHHSVQSILHVRLPWADAEALFLTLDGVLRSGQYVAPSHLDAVTALRDLLAERIYVLRSVVVEDSRPQPEPAPEETL